VGCCDCCHELGIYCKKGLAIPDNKPKLNIPPRPGPGSSGSPVPGSPSTPGASGPLLNLGLFFFLQTPSLLPANSVTKVLQGADFTGEGNAYHISETPIAQNNPTASIAR
jgi:hypothetical protein